MKKKSFQFFRQPNKHQWGVKKKMPEPEVLEIKASDGMKAKDVFGNLGNQMAGIGGTLHITKEADLDTVPKLAWQLAQQTQKPVVVVVRPS